MTRSRLLVIALPGLLMAAPALAQVSIGFGLGRGYPYTGLYLPYYHGGYAGPLGSPYLDPYPIYRSPQIFPRGGDPMIPGAVSYVDEGAYRNYRDRAGNHLGRVALSEIPAHRW